MLLVEVSGGIGVGPALHLVLPLHKEAWAYHANNHRALFCTSWVLPFRALKENSYRPDKHFLIHSFKTYCVWKSQKNVSFTTLRPKRAMFTFWLDWNAKNGQFDDFLKSWSLWLHSVSRQVNFFCRKIDLPWWILGTLKYHTECLLKKVRLSKKLIIYPIANFGLPLETHLLDYALYNFLQ